jgi:hypothetical protein
MQGVSIAGGLGKYFAIQTFCFRELTFLMKGNSVLKHRAAEFLSDKGRAATNQLVGTSAIRTASTVPAGGRFRLFVARSCPPGL